MTRDPGEVLRAVCDQRRLPAFGELDPDSCYLGWELELDDGLVYPISAPSVLLGRSPTGDDPALQYLAVRDLTRTLSKVHARLDRMGEDWRIIDLGSTNGVIVLDDDDTPHAVTAGADAVLAGRRFVLGHVAMRLQRTDADTDR